MVDKFGIFETIVWLTQEIAEGCAVTFHFCPGVPVKAEG